MFIEMLILAFLCRFWSRGLFRPQKPFRRRRCTALLIVDLDILVPRASTSSTSSFVVVLGFSRTLLATVYSAQGDKVLFFPNHFWGTSVFQYKHFNNPYLSHYVLKCVQFTMSWIQNYFLPQRHVSEPKQRGGRVKENACVLALWAAQMQKIIYGRKTFCAFMHHWATFMVMNWALPPTLVLQ